MKQDSALDHKNKYGVARLVLTLFILAIITGCTANYGQYKRSLDVAGWFESLQVPSEYKYYYTGSDKNPDALMGLHKDYILNNDLWKETEMDRSRLKKWIDEFNPFGYSGFVFGQYILDPGGKIIGIYYSRYDGGPVKMEADNQVVIHLPDTHQQKRPMLLMRNDFSN